MDILGLNAEFAVVPSLWKKFPPKLLVGWVRKSVAHLLYSITMLANENIPRVIDKIRLSGKNDLDIDKYGYAKKYPHYFEPGITNYKKFGSVTRKLNRNR